MVLNIPWWIFERLKGQCHEIFNVFFMNQFPLSPWVYTDKKENNIFLIYREIQSGAVAKSYMRKGFLIYEEMGIYFHIYEEAVSHIWLCNCSTLNFLIYEENLIFFFISVTLGPFQIFWKFAEIFAAQGAPPLSLTPVANAKNLQSEKF